MFQQRPTGRRKRPPCPTCRSTRYRRKDGLLYCEFGHQLKGYVEEAADDIQEGKSLGRRLRLKKQRKQKTRSQVVCGAEGVMLAYEAFQCILEIQTRAMIESHGFPPELENVVHDLWMLLSECQDIPWIEVKEEPGDGTVASAQPSQATASQLQRIYGAGVDGIDDDQEDLGSVAGSDDESEGEGRRGLRIRYNDNDGSGSTAAAAQAPAEPKLPPLPRPHSADSLHIAHALCIIYIACLHLRLPILVADIHRMCCNNELPYLAVFEQIPKELRQTLSRSLHHLLQPWYLPHTVRLRAMVGEMCAQLHEHYGIVPPVVPVRAHLARLVMEWAVPPEFYVGAAALAQALEEGARRDQQQRQHDDAATAAAASAAAAAGPRTRSAARSVNPSPDSEPEAPTASSPSSPHPPLPPCSSPFGWAGVRASAHVPRGAAHPTRPYARGAGGSPRDPELAVLAVAELALRAGLARASCFPRASQWVAAMRAARERWATAVAPMVPAAAGATQQQLPRHLHRPPSPPPPPPPLALVDGVPETYPALMTWAREHPAQFAAFAAAAVPEFGAPDDAWLDAVRELDVALSRLEGDALFSGQDVAGGKRKATDAAIGDHDDDAGNGARRSDADTPWPAPDGSDFAPPLALVVPRNVRDSALAAQMRAILGDSGKDSAPPAGEDSNNGGDGKQEEEVDQKTWHNVRQVVLHAARCKDADLEIVHWHLHPKILEILTHQQADGRGS